MSICGLGRGAEVGSGDGRRADVVSGCAGCAVNGGSDECCDENIRVRLKEEKRARGHSGNRKEKKHRMRQCRDAGEKGTQMGGMGAEEEGRAREWG